MTTGEIRPQETDPPAEPSTKEPLAEEHVPAQAPPPTSEDLAAEEEAPAVGSAPAEEGAFPAEEGAPAEEAPAVEGEPAAEGELAAVPEPAVLVEPGGLAVPAVVPVPRRKATVIAGVAAAVYLAVAVAVTVLLVVPVAPRLLGVTPTDRVLAAATGLASAAEVHYTGVADGSLRLDVKVGADGALHGTATNPDSGKAEFLALSGTTYARADRAWWLHTDAEHAGIYTGHWMTMTNGRLGFDPAALLTPAKLAKAVRAGLTEDPVLGTNTHRASTLTTDRPGTLHGTAVDVFHTRAGITAYVTTAQPYRLVAVDGPMSVAGGDQSESFALDLTVGTASDRTSLNTEVHKAATGLDADKDPADPASYGVKPGTVKQGTCDENSCTHSLQVVNTGSTPSKGTGYLLGRYVADKLDGTQIDTCRAPIPALQPGGTATVSCTTSSALWKVWALLGGGGYYFTYYTFSPGWQGSDPAPIAELLTHFATLSASDDVRFDISPVEAAQVLNSLLAAKGWTGATATTTVNAVKDAGGLGDLHDLLASSRFTLDPSYSSSIGLISPRAWPEAARRLRAGSGKIAVGDWTGPDSTQYYGDVFDLGAHQVVHFAAVVHPSVAEDVKDLAQGAKSFATNSVPAGFTEQLRVGVDPDSVLYRAGRSQIRTELKRAGLTPDMLNGAQVLMDTAYGTVTFTPADFR